MWLKLIVAFVVAVALGTGAYVFADTNTVPASQAGSGFGSISGYTIGTPTYTLNATTPTNLDAVAFTITPTTATTVKAQLASGGTWYSCTNTTGNVSCNTTVGVQATVAGATQLTVVATG